MLGFWGTLILFTIMAMIIYIPTNSVEDFPFWKRGIILKDRNILRETKFISVFKNDTSPSKRGSLLHCWWEFKFHIYTYICTYIIVYVVYLCICIFQYVDAFLFLGKPLYFCPKKDKLELSLGQNQSWIAHLCFFSSPYISKQMQQLSCYF